MLPLDISALNMQEYFLLDINEMKRNDLWLNVKGNYTLFDAKILFEFTLKYLGPNLIEISEKQCNFTEFWLFS